MMRLFHCSNEKYTTLTPRVGARRHGGEGAGAADKAVIWLSNDGASVAREGGRVVRFRHKVEVLHDDPNLVLDEKLEEGRLWAEREYGKPIRVRWYTYSKPLHVISVAAYDEEREEYFPV
jgi:hypothetical protein